jgi:hypothetical protein
MAMALIPLSTQSAGFAASASSVANRPHRNIPVGGTYVGTDGFKPVLYTTPDGHHEAWMISHHAYTGQTIPRVSCVNVDTGTLCADTAGRPTTWPKPLNTSAGPLGGGNTGNLATTEVVQTVTDGKLIRYPAVTTTPLPGFPSGSVGVGCLDMDTQANCAYVPLAALTNVPGASNVNGLTGFDEVGGKLYGSLTNGKVICYDIAAGTPCAGQPYASTSPPNTDRAGLAPDDFIGSTELVAGKIFVSSNPQYAAKTLHPGPPAVTCFDPATNRMCAGFGTKTITNPAAHDTVALTGHFLANGTADGACAFTGNRSFPAPITTCWDFHGDPLPAPPELSSAFPPAGTNSVVFQPLTANVMGELRSYFPSYTEDRVHLGFTACYSWTTQSACHVFPGPLASQNTLGGDTHPYGYGYNPENNCLYGIGHTGYMFSLNATTGSFGC